jgi:hypothetical protein
VNVGLVEGAPTFTPSTFHWYVGVPPFVGVAVKVTLLPRQMLVALAETVTLGVTAALTVTLAEPEQPLTVYVIVAEPAETPVTTPPAETVATAKSEELQVPPAILPVRVVVAPAQTVVVPLTVGLALMVIVTSEPVVEGSDAITRTLYPEPVDAPAGIVKEIGLVPVAVAIGEAKLPAAFDN